MYLQILHQNLSKSSKIFQKNWSHFNQETLLKIENKNINVSLETYLEKINSLAPLLIVMLFSKQLANINLNLKLITDHCRS